MSYQLSYEVIQEDVEMVFLAYPLRILTCGSITRIAKQALNELDTDRISKAAISSSDDLDEQTKAAFDEIKNQLVDLGYLEF